MRLVQIPNTLRLSRSDDHTVRDIIESCVHADIRKPLLLSGASKSREIVESLLPLLTDWAPVAKGTVDHATIVEAAALATRVARENLDGVVAVGGGRSIDVAKLAAHYSGVPFIAVPTQIAHDGICSPIAVVSDGARKASLAAKTPAAVVVPLHTIEQAPLDCTRAGVGDLLSNFCALNDWRLACDAGLDTYDDFAGLIARLAAESALAQLRLRPDLTDMRFLEVLIEGLMLNGIAMSIAGSSRPCSGSEHLVSHAIDYLTGGVALHGLQVAAATPLMLQLQGDRALAEEIRELYEWYGMPTNVAKLLPAGISYDHVMRLAPEMRLNRYTVLSTSYNPTAAVRPQPAA